MKNLSKIISIFILAVLTAAFCSCNGAVGDALATVNDRITENNNYTVTIHSTVENSITYTETIYAFAGDKEYEKIPGAERVYINENGRTSIYTKNNEGEWALYATVNAISLRDFALFLKPFLIDENYKYDKKAGIYVMLTSVYENEKMKGIENVWCEFEGDDLIIYYNEILDGEMVITDMRISKIDGTDVKIK